MGGYGSGRSPWRTRRWTVEECLSLSLTHLRTPLNRAAAGGAPSLGAIRWTSGEQVTSTVAYLVLPQHSGTLPAVRLSYMAETRGGKSVQSVQRVHTVQVTATPMPRGGRRWWWLCPYPGRGVPCGRRVGKLYLPPGEITFGCRLCHDLTYTSCLESHKYDALAAQLAARWSSEFPGVTPRAVKWVLRALRNG